MLKKILFVSSFFSSTYLTAQQTGKTVFDFLNHPTSARMTGLAGNMIATKDQDVALAWANPAALHSEMNGQIAVNYDLLFQGAGVGYLGYARQINKLNMTFHTGLQYANYGVFQAADEFGNVNGDFKAQDMALAIGAAKVLSDKWSLGANLKFIYSNLENYTATGLSSDIAATYFDKDKNLTFTVLAKNAGTQLTTYTAAPKGILPFDLQAGFSKKLKHLPLRFSIIGRDLLQRNVIYKDPNVVVSSSLFGEENKEPSKISKGLDNITRHLIVNGEFLLGKKETFCVRVGYSHQGKKELSVSPFRSVTGLSYGFGIKVKRFKLDFGRNTTHLAGGMTHIGLSTKI